jgi:ribose transport system permease protein
VGPRGFAARYSTELQLLLGLVVVYSIFAALYPSTFVTADNTANMARQGGILLIVAIAQMFALVVGGFDISVGANMGFVATATALAMSPEGGIPQGVLIGLGAGAAIGLVNGIIIAGGRVNPLITTLGMSTFLLGLGFELNDAQPVFDLPEDFFYLGALDWGPVPAPLAIGAIVMLAVWLAFARTRAGLYIYAIGGSRETCRRAGSPVVRIEILAYTACGLLAGLAGIVLGARVSIASPDIGAGYELDSIAAAVIGGALIGGGVGRIGGIVLAVAALTVLQTGLDVASVQEFVQRMVTGVVLVVAVLVAQLRSGGLRDVGRTLGLRRRNGAAPVLRDLASARRAAR